MSLWDNINKKRQRIKQGSGEKMRKKGDKGAPTPDQIKRAKGEDMEEGKMKQAMMRRQDMAKLAGLYSKAMKAMPGSPKQKALKKQIDQYRRELGMNESVNEIRQPLTVPKSLAKFVVYKKTGLSKIKQVAHLRAMPKGKELDRVLDKYDADGVIAMSKIKRNKMQVEAVNEVASDKWRDDIAMDVAKKNPKTHGHALELIRKHPTMKKLFKKGVNPMRGADFNDELLGTVDKILKSKGKKYMRPGGPKESVSEAKDDAEYNDEGGMAIGQLKTAKSAVEELMSIIKDDDNLPEWVQSKLTKAVDYMDSVRDYMASEKDDVKEAVSPAQQAAIAISKKEKMKEDDFEPHMMYDPKTGKGYKAEKPEDHERMKKMGYTHEKPEVKEAKGDRPTPYQVNIRGEGGVAVKAKDMDDAVKKAFKELGIATRFMRDKTFMRKVKVSSKYNEVKEAKDDLFQVNVKGEGGVTVRASSEKDAINKAFRKLGIATRFTRDRRFMTKVQVFPAESVEESRAYRDAMKGMKSRSATRGMATTKKDKDTEASDDDRKAANKNIIMQLRKAADLPTGANIEFERGKGKVSRAQAQAALARFNALAKPNDKEKFQKSIRSLSDIKKILGR